MLDTVDQMAKTILFLSGLMLMISVIVRPDIENGLIGALMMIVSLRLD